MKPAKPLPGYRPQCDAGRLTGEPHDIDGSHYGLCIEHHDQHTRWRKARNTYVARQKKEAAEAGEPFDEDAVRRAREEEKPWEPNLLSARARGALPVPPAQVRMLRATINELIDAKLPIDTAHREGEGVTAQQIRRLLTAIEKHAVLVNRLLKPVKRSD